LWRDVILTGEFRTGRVLDCAFTGPTWQLTLWLLVSDWLRTV